MASRIPILEKDLEALSPEMRAVFTLASIALAVAPKFVLSRGNLGFALGTKNLDGSCKSTSDYENDFDAIKSNTGSIFARG